MNSFAAFSKEIYMTIPGDLQAQTDEMLLEALRVGNMSAFNILFDKYSQRAVEFASLITQDIFLAEEIVSDVFLSFWARRESLPEKINFQPYLYTSVKYRAKTLSAINRKAKLVSLDQYSGQISDSPLHPGEPAKGNELGAILQRAIQELPKQRRVIFELKKMDGLSYKTIASLLQISERTVEKQMAHALKTLRISLSKYKLLILFFLH